jgi:hypothetical protein
MLQVELLLRAGIILCHRQKWSDAEARLKQAIAFCDEIDAAKTTLEVSTVPERFAEMQRQHSRAQAFLAKAQEHRSDDLIPLFLAFDNPAPALLIPPALGQPTGIVARTAGRKQQWQEFNQRLAADPQSLWDLAARFFMHRLLDELGATLPQDNRYRSFFVQLLQILPNEASAACCGFDAGMAKCFRDALIKIPPYGKQLLNRPESLPDCFAAYQFGPSWRLGQILKHVSNTADRAAFEFAEHLVVQIVDRIFDSLRIPVSDQSQPFAAESFRYLEGLMRSSLVAARLNDDATPKQLQRPTLARLLKQAMKADSYLHTTTRQGLAVLAARPAPPPPPPNCPTCRRRFP